MAKIVSVYNREKPDFVPVDMSYIRWLKIAERLAALGHQVDIASIEPIPEKSPILMGPNLRRISLKNVHWQDYDVVKTVFHRGFETLEFFGGTGHPFIISKLGSVVASHDMEGVYFYGELRKELYETQLRIQKTSRYVTLLSPQAKELWLRCFQSNGNILLVPGAADKQIPEFRKNPFPEEAGIRCLFAGNIYTLDRQPEANAVLVSKLNELGRILKSAGAQLFMIGVGEVRLLDAAFVKYLGKVPYEETWDYLRSADVGVVVSSGKFHQNNESSKIYHYLRAGLPVVSEAGFPNDFLIHESGLGFSVESGNMELMAEKVLEAGRTPWDRQSAIRYILDNHTWENRVQVYNRLITEELEQV
ncbi:glycosyltransferase [bacterium]|nr:glycosyltransferase [bacterium]